MLLQQLTEVLEAVKDKIANQHDFFTNNELQTRVTLIDPVLKALGWDTLDPTRIRVEFSVKQRRRTSARTVDYALLDDAGAPIALIEAKRLHESLGSHHLQLLEYATHRRAPYAIATDGNVWELFKKEQSDEGLALKKLIEINITRNSTTVTALKFLTLWGGILTSNTSIDEIAPVLNKLEVQEPVVPVSPKLPVVPPPPDPPLSGRIVPVTEFANVSAEGFKPKSVTFPDKSTVEARTLSAILVESVAWLSKTDNLKVPMPWKAGKTGNTYVVNTEPKHANGKQFHHSKKINEYLFVNTNYSGHSLQEITRRLLEECGVDLSAVTVNMEKK